MAQDIRYDSKLERVIVEFPKDAVKITSGQKYTLGLRFESELEGSMMGYYKSTYTLPDGSTGNYALTQFEPTAARRAFPCFDEPDIKATFGVTLVSRTSLTVLGNLPVENTATDVNMDDLLGSAETQADTIGSARQSDACESWTATTFETSPKMSTYLVAWANGDFRYLDSSFTSPLTGKKIPLRVYTTPEHIHQAQTVLDVKARVLPVYEKLFNVEYPLPKLDTLVADDFEAGAMENWGLITGATDMYLLDEKNGSIDSRKMLTIVQSHEVAHQWFGNVVTMRWWDNLWLNESFATLMGEVISIAELHPEWKPDSSFLDTQLRRALELDALRSSHPVEQPCPDPEMINQIFDAISYSKGAAVLRMLSNMIGQDTFLKGVSIYLKNHLYGNSRTADLWDGISQASGVDVAKIMSNWTLKIGFPVITVEEASEGLKVRQNRFLSTGDASPEEDETLWYVPLELKKVDQTGKATTDHKAILESRETTLKLEDAANATYKLNAETAGVYRVFYSPERLAKLADEAGKGAEGAFSLNDRVGLVQDAFVLAKAGYGKTSGYLQLTSKLQGEREHLVWNEVASGLAGLKDVWWEQPDKVREALDKLSSKMFTPVAKELGWDVKDSDSPDTRQLRAMALANLAASGDEETINEARRRFDLFADQDDASAIPGDLLNMVFANATRFGGALEYEKALKIYRKPPTPHHKLACMQALCVTRESALIERTIAFMHSEEVKTQDLMHFYGGLAVNRYSRRQIWQDLQKDLANLVNRFQGSMTLGRVVISAFERFSNEEDLEAIVKFFEANDTKEFDQSVKQGIDAIRGRVAWLKRDARDVEDWLRENGYLL